MAKTFLTNINLKGNQLLNAVIQSASSAPTAYAAGQLYFNTVDNLFYYSTAAGTGSWVPVGVQYISSVGSNLAVNNGELDLGAKVVITDATQSLSNKTLLGVTVQGNTYFQSSGGAGGQNNYITVDANSGKLYVHSGYGVQVDATGDVVLNPTGAAYVGSASADNEIATVGGNQTLSNKTISDELHFVNGGTDGFIAGQAGQLVINANNGLSTTSDGDTTITTTVGNIILNADGDVYKGSATANNRIITVGDIPTLELHIEGTSNQIVLGTDTNNGYTQISLDPETYIKRASDQYPSIMLNANTATISLNDPNTDSRVLDIYNTDANAVIKSGYSLNLESQSGDITLSPSTGIIQAVGQELHITKVQLQDVSNNDKGVIVAHPTDGSLTVASTGWLHLESHSGDIDIDPQSGQTNFNGQTYINSNGTIGTQNYDLTLAPDSGNVVINSTLVTDAIVSKNGTNDTLDISASTLQINSSNVTIGGGGINGGLTVKNSNGDTHFNVDVDNNTVTVKGELKFLDLGGVFEALEAVDGNTDFQIAADYNIVLNSTNGSSYLQSVDANNKIATIGDLNALVSGLTWKNSVNLLWDDSNAGLSGSTGTLVIDGHPALGSSQDGYRILITSGVNAGIWTYNDNGTSWSLTRPVDSATFTDLKGAAVFVEEGTKYGSTSWVQTNHYLTDFTGQSWVQFSGNGSVTAGTGITVDGLQISINRATTDTWYDAAGSATTAQSNAESYTDTKVAGLSYTTTITGDSTTTSFPITHGLGTRAVNVTVFQSSAGPDDQWAEVVTDVLHYDRNDTNNVNKITIGFAKPFDNSVTYQVVVTK